MTHRLGPGILIFCCVASASKAAEADSAPPAITVSLDASAAGAADLHGSGTTARSGASRDGSFSAIWRTPVHGASWYGALGVESESTQFASGDSALPRRLQSVAAALSLEYQVSGETAAALNLHPGWYYETHLSARAFDVPIDGYTSIPIAGAWSGVVGGSNGRFLHHPIPIFGVDWKPNPSWDAEAVFPEPSITAHMGRGWSARIAGQLLGAGYRRDSGAVVEYWSYRVGPSLVWKGSAGEFALGGGEELERAFDAFRHGPDLEGRGGAYVELSATFRH